VVLAAIDQLSSDLESRQEKLAFVRFFEDGGKVARALQSLCDVRMEASVYNPVPGWFTIALGEVVSAALFCSRLQSSVQTAPSAHEDWLLIEGELIPSLGEHCRLSSDVLDGLSSSGRTSVLRCTGRFPASA
jgi:hypothetical protein